MGLALDLAVKKYTEAQELLKKDVLVYRDYLTRLAREVENLKDGSN